MIIVKYLIMVTTFMSVTLTFELAGMVMLLLLLLFCYCLFIRDTANCKLEGGANLIFLYIYIHLQHMG